MLTLTDLFCGAGGSSTGAIQTEGVRVRMAANHWQLAVDIHNANHPTADHAAADIHQADPHYFPRTDILWASPECTKWSQASGRRQDDLDEGLWEDPLSDEARVRSRMLMFDVPRFAEVHRYRAIIVENVVDVAMRPKYQHAFKLWLSAMGGLGYEHQVVSLNSMHAQSAGLPAPQSRDRLYVVFWRKGDRRPDLERMQRPRAYCPRCDAVVESRQAWKPGRTVGKYRAQYVYLCSTAGCGETVEPGWLPAAHAIDWALPGTLIGERAKPLADKTRRRIAAGIARYWHPLTLEAAGHTYDAADPKHVSYDDPNGYYRAWSSYDVLKTLHTIESKALAIPVEGRDGKQPRPMGEPFRTMTTRLETAMVTPFIAELRGGGSDARSTTDPMSTVTASGNHHGLVSPYYGASESAKSTDDSLGTLTTVDRYALVTRHNGSKGEGAEMTTPIWEQLRTLTTTAQQSILTPGDLKAAEAQVDDCLFRMLEPHEVAAGMAFPADYIWDGNRRDRVKMAGNAVTPPAARDLVACVAEALR